MGIADKLNRRFWEQTALRLVAVSALIWLGFDLFKLHRQGMPQQGKKYPAEVSRDPSTLLYSDKIDYVVVDTVLAMIQAYYVDIDQVDMSTLRERMWTILAEEHPQVTLSDDKSLLFVAGDLQIQRGDAHSVEALIEEMYRISEYLEPSPQSHRGSKEFPERIYHVLSYLVRGLDAHSNLLDPKLYRDLKDGTEGVFGGLGLMVGIRAGILTVIKAMAGGPSERLGILKGDRIVKIDNTSTFGFGLDDLVGKMRGDPGSSVNLTVLRSGQIAPLKIQVPREIIQVESVEWTIQKQGEDLFGYVLIESFTHKTARELERALEAIDLQSKGDLAGLILDLRSNPGGLLDQAVAVSDLFIDEGVIVSTEGRRIEQERARPKKWRPEVPLVVLIDGDTASASEIVAGALQDHNRAVVMGQPSYGKGSVQTIFELPYDVALKLTVARYFTPLRQNIQENGIDPDILLTPVYQNVNNKNLLGSSRLRSERFLTNHLRGSPRERDRSLFESLYLADKDFVVDVEGIDHDYVASAAIQFLSLVHHFYENGLPDGTHRASHWLQAVLADFEALLSDMNGQSNRFLKENFDVDWSRGDRLHVNAPMDIQVPQKSFKLQRLGQSIKVPIRISNPNRFVIPKVSVIAKPIRSGFLEVETLVGKMISASVWEGKIEVTAEHGMQEGVIPFQVQILANGVPMSHTKQSFTLHVEGLIEDPIFIDPNLVELNYFYQRDLKENLRAAIRLQLHNKAPYPLEEIKLGVVSLAGEVLNLSEKDLFVRDLKAFESRDVSIPISIHPSLKAAVQVEVGVFLSTEGLGIIQSIPLNIPIKEENQMKIAH